ncbi:hypothetical protein LUZ60_015479 [Juncus effusus]|nr:hypothetical protein LUZ60_015479 [Juncus effusus]
MAAAAALSFRRKLLSPFQTGAIYYINYATSTSIRQNYPSYDNINKYQENKNPNSEIKYEDLQRRVAKPLCKPTGRKSAREKRKFLINTLFELKESKEEVYGKLDSWVAWEQSFPLALLKQSLVVLEKHKEWHRIIQVLKWMLSKGQCTTVGTYEQLIKALEKDNRAEEAHQIWEAKMSRDLHSVPWRFCELIMDVYYRNNMLDRLITLFRGLESYGRKPPNKNIVRKIADAYEMLGLSEEKDKLLAKYSYLSDDSSYQHKRKKNNKSKKTVKNDGKEDKNQDDKIETLDNIAVDS